MNFQDGQSTRTTVSSFPGRDRSQPPQQPPQPQPSQEQTEKIAQIEKSVTHLLVATKQLLEILTAWSRREATEVAVSDVYVRLGYEFNIACRAFNSIGVDTQDLGPVPDSLRGILEDALSNEPSQTSLEQYLPHIRDIIVNLLQGLKRKQQRLRLRNARDDSPFTNGDLTTTRQSSSGSIRSTISLTDERQPSGPVQRVYSSEVNGQNTAATPSRISSAPTGGRASPVAPETGVIQRVRSTRNPFSAPTTESRAITTGIQLPGYTIAPPPPPPPQVRQDVSPGQSNSPFSPPASDQTQAKDQPKQQDALAALQRGGDLERRASRRFSAYQIQKHLGPGSSGIPMIPPSQNSPIPNRGRETREGINAARMRGSPLANTERNPVDTTQSPPRQRALQEPAVASIPERPQVSGLADSPTIKTPEEMYKPMSSGTSMLTRMSAAVVPTPYVASVAPTTTTYNNPQATTMTAAQETPSTSTTMPTKELTLFLQYKNQVKKLVLSDNLEDLSVAQLQLAFIDKFAWNSHSNGADLPEIYIQDPVSGIRYELEDLNDVKNNAVLVLNVDALDDVKRHFDESMGGIRELVQGIRSSVDGQQSVLQLVSEVQQDTAKNLARLNAMPPSAPLQSSTLGSTVSDKGTAGRLVEVQSLRRDLATMRQTYTNLTTDMENSMADLRSKASTIKTAAVTASIPTFDTFSGRAYVDEGRKTLSDDSEKIINRVDDLADLVEDLRKDVVARGVRPLPRQLESVNKEISLATAELKKMQEFIKREKPIWTKIWRTELEAVYDDQKALSMQEELAADLDKDLSEAANTFALVEEATKQQNVQPSSTPSANGTPTRTRSQTVHRTMAFETSGDPQKAKDTVLGEVRALQPNHETRLEAIERAERARLKDLESRGEGAFKKELGDFVDEGRFKKTGGIEELEKSRQVREDSIRKGTWTGTKASEGNSNVAAEPTTETGPPVHPRMMPSPLEGTLDGPGSPFSSKNASAPTQGDPANIVVTNSASTSASTSTLRENTDQHFETAAESLPTPNSNSTSQPVSPVSNSGFASNGSLGLDKDNYSIENSSQEPEFVEAVEDPKALASPPLQAQRNSATDMGLDAVLGS